MAITVETGSGSASADALVSVADADTYHTNHGNSTWTGADGVKEEAIRRATNYLNSLSWQGYRTNGRDQSLQWPRSGVLDREGYGIGSDTIPVEITNACAILALRELVTPGTLAPDNKVSDAVSRERIGDLEVEYASPARSASAKTPEVSEAMALVGQFLKAGAGNNIAGTSYRT